MAIRPAATILLLRDAAVGVEVFMVRRNPSSAFVGGAYVFPGGRVDVLDAIDPGRCSGLDARTADQRLGVAGQGLAFHVAAVRECFEEAGVLLAYDRQGNLLDFSAPEADAHYRSLRDRLNAGTLSFGALLEQEDLTLALDRLAYLSHWITPMGEPRRFDTRFFAAEAPANQVAAHDDWELTDSDWVRPDEATERARKREWQIILPTMANLRAIADHPSAAEAVSWARRQRLPLPAILPKVYQGRLVLPGDEDYDLGEPDISLLDREGRDRAFLP
ncbi:MAG: NUDIX hydrolase [Gemmatimonadales bacterium]|nr:NUDIX hydrolase [Gemmatimonadales bacterium]